MAARVPERESMALKDRVTAAMIRLDIGSERSLFIVFGADGTVNRMGTGEEGSVEKRFFAGSTREPILARFLDGVREQALESPGSFVLPEPKGTPTTLDIRFVTDDRELKFQFQFGSESEGPPGEICGWVERAVELTDPWYEEEKKRASRT